MSQLTDVIAKLNTATNALGVRFKALTDRLIAAEANAVTPEDQAEIDAIAGSLDAMGRDPANPVPTEPVV